MNKKLLISNCLAIALLIITGCGTPTEPTEIADGTHTNIGELQFDYMLDYAEGECKGIADCHKVEYGCGKIICTNEPDKYEDMVTDCAIDENQPNPEAYNCGCVPNEYKCGWIKK